GRERRDAPARAADPAREPAAADRRSIAGGPASKWSRVGLPFTSFPTRAVLTVRRDPGWTHAFRLRLGKSLLDRMPVGCDHNLMSLAVPWTSPVALAQARRSAYRSRRWRCVPVTGHRFAGSPA